MLSLKSSGKSWKINLWNTFIRKIEWNQQQKTKTDFLLTIVFTDKCWVATGGKQRSKHHQSRCVMLFLVHRAFPIMLRWQFRLIFGKAHMEAWFKKKPNISEKWVLYMRIYYHIQWRKSKNTWLKEILKTLLW